MNNALMEKFDTFEELAGAAVSACKAFVKSERGKLDRPYDPAPRGMAHSALTSAFVHGLETCREIDPADYLQQPIEDRTYLMSVQIIMTAFELDLLNLAKGIELNASMGSFLRNIPKRRQPAVN